MASELKLPTRSPEIFHRHDLLLPSGIYRAEIRESINVIFLLVSGTGAVLVRQVAPLELEAHEDRVYQDLYAAWRTIEPTRAPVLMHDAAPREMSAKTRRVIEALGYRIS